jgi:hypothetical protein
MLPARWRELKQNPSRLARLLAIIALPAMALSIWLYSVVMSLGAVTPLQSATESSTSFTSDLQGAINIDANNTAPIETPVDASSNSVDLKVDSTTSNNSTRTDVQVDGQSIPVPTDGSSHQVIQNDNGTTTIDINVDSDNSGSSRTRSSTNVNLKSSSSMDVDIESRESQ